VAAHGGGHVINICYGRLYNAGCGTITGRPLVHGPCIKICPASLAELDRWALQRTGRGFAALRDMPAASARSPGYPSAFASPGDCGRRRRFSKSAFTATMTLDPDMLSAPIAGLSVKPRGANTPAAIGSASML